MKKLSHYQHHRCAPKEWRHTNNMTGSYELDAMIEHTKNKDMADRLRDHLDDNQTGYSFASDYRKMTKD